MHYFLLVAGLVIFLGVHSISMVAPAWREAAVAWFSEITWKLLYGILALGGLLLIAKGFPPARSASLQVYAPPLAFQHLGALLMLPVFPLLLAAYLPGRIRSGTGHPMLLAVILWAGAHLLANGALADILLFGSFLVWAVAQRLSLRRRVARPVRVLPEGRYNDLIAVVGGFALYVWFVASAHAQLFGVYPLRG